MYLMRTLWFDALTPKQLRIAKYVRELATKRGYSFLLTSRKYDELSGMAELLGLKPEFIGEHGGSDSAAKLKASVNRLSSLLRRLADEELGCIVCHGSPEATRIGFGKGAFTININDSPHAEAVARLTIPLTTKLISSSYIPARAWKAYGLRTDGLIQYRGFEVVSWLKRERESQVSLPEKLRRPIVAFRPEEIKAAYLHVGTKDSYLSSALREAQEELGFSLVVLPRYKSQRRALRESLPDSYVLDRQIDGLALIDNCDVFIGAGGTMTWEAALSGKPTLSAFPMRTYVGAALGKVGLITHTTSKELKRRLKHVLTESTPSKNKRQQRAASFLGSLEDPLEVLGRTIP